MKFNISYTIFSEGGRFWSYSKKYSRVVYKSSQNTCRQRTCSLQGHWLRENGQLFWSFAYWILKLFFCFWLLKYSFCQILFYKILIDVLCCFRMSLYLHSRLNVFEFSDFLTQVQLNILTSDKQRLFVYLCAVIGGTQYYESIIKAIVVQPIWCQSW